MAVAAEATQRRVRDPAAPGRRSRDQCAEPPVPPTRVRTAAGTPMRTAAVRARRARPSGAPTRTPSSWKRCVSAC